MNSEQLNITQRGTGQILGEAWDLVTGLKLPVVSIVVLNIFLLFCFKVLARLLEPVFNHGGLSFLFGVIVAFIPFFINFFFTCTQIILGMRRAIGMPVRVNDAYEDCKRSWFKIFQILMLVYVGGLVVFFVGVAFGMLTIFVHGSLIISFILWMCIFALCLYLFFPLTLFVLPLVVLKNFTLKQALPIGYRTMNAHWKQIFPCIFFMWVILALSAIPLGVGLIWTIPMNVAMMGVIYRDFIKLV